MTYVIAQPCVDVLDKACIEECPVDCIYEGDRMLYIHPDECVDCGACEPVCPVEAIDHEDDVPEQWKDYYKINVDFFEEPGSPGGASEGREDRQGRPHRGGPAAAGRGATLASRLPDTPGTSSPRSRRRPELSPAGRSTCPWAPRSTRCPRSSGCPHRGRQRARLPADRGYPQLRSAAAGWLSRSLDVHVDPASVLPVIGTKEFIAWLPVMLGLGPAETAIYRLLAYPTDHIGAPLAGAPCRWRPMSLTRRRRPRGCSG